MSFDLCNQFFKNEEFMNIIKEKCKDEFQLLESMKTLANLIKEEAQSLVYNES